MNYRRVGRAGLKISELSIGAWLTYGSSVDPKTADKIINAALALGVNFIDLSDAYGKGQAEEVIGRIIKDRTRSDLVISSKLFWPMSDNINDRGLSRKHIMESVEKSLKRLGTDYLDIYYCHRFDPEVEVEEVVLAMTDLIRQGKVIYWGTSVWPSDQIERACGIARDWRGYSPVVEQPRYNLLDRHIETDIMAACARNGLGLTVWSPLAQGFLSGKYLDGTPENSRGATTKFLRNDLNEQNLDKARQLNELAKSLNITLSQLALAWILRRPEISCAITGATSVAQLEENLKATEIRLTPETLREIEKIMQNKPIIPLS